MNTPTSSSDTNITQVCTKCATQKPLTEFPKKRSGRARHCKACMRSYSKEHYQQNKEHRIAQTTARSKAERRTRRQLIEAASTSQVCDICQAHPSAITDTRGVTRSALTGFLPDGSTLAALANVEVPLNRLVQALSSPIVWRCLRCTAAHLAQDRPEPLSLALIALGQEGPISPKGALSRLSASFPTTTLESIYVTLGRLVQEGRMLRVRRGIYVAPSTPPVPESAV